MVGAYFANFHRSRRNEGFLNTDDANNKEYCDIILVDVEVLETMRIEEEPPIDDKIQLIETFAEAESAPGFKGFEVLHNIVLDIVDKLPCSDVQTEVG